MPVRKEPDASADVPSFYGAELRFKREAAGLTLKELVAGSYRGISLLSQIERGERRMPLDLARHVDKVLETDGFFERRCEDVQKAKQSGHAEYFADAAAIEKHAASIEDWGPMLLPGLLQTEAFARKVVTIGSPWLRPEAVEKQVKARMDRAKVWRAEDRPEIWTIVHESLIRRPLLPSEEMAVQLEHVAHVIRSTRGVLQILPETLAAHPFMMGMVKVMTFPDAPPVVYTEGLHTGQLIDCPGLVTDYRRSYDLLRAVALSPDTSLDMVEQAADDYRNGKLRA
ncbi:Scr1 family TA system antitoxin-like transcriptional regulator [Streptomyces sp. NBC_00986]|uniref:helix-turn-helix domain-containing protein n=1 Tax=Streptomyces sp. NBC_00986 TaxID=2903702 RepID=UPI0038687C75|nr:helix-turn-helix transcriptional regulator [Streptomyces sp. NBC_00986]